MVRWTLYYPTRGHPCKKQIPTFLTGGSGKCPAKMKHGQTCVPSCAKRFRINEREGGKRTCWLGKIIEKNLKCLPLFDNNMCPANRKTKEQVAEDKERERILLEEEGKKQKEKDEQDEKQMREMAKKQSSSDKESILAQFAFIKLEMQLKTLPNMLASMVTSTPAPGKRLSDTAVDYVKFGKFGSFSLAETKKNSDRYRTVLEKSFGKEDKGQAKFLNIFCTTGFCPPAIGKHADNTVGVGGNCVCQKKHLLYPKKYCKDKDEKRAKEACEIKVAGERGDKGCTWKVKSGLKQIVSNECKHVDEASQKFTEEYDKMVVAIDCAHDLIDNVNKVAKLAQKIEEKAKKAKDVFKDGK
jgi:hypothetical protein